MLQGSWEEHKKIRNHQIDRFCLLFFAFFPFLHTVMSRITNKINDPTMSLTFVNWLPPLLLLLLLLLWCNIWFDRALVVAHFQSIVGESKQPIPLIVVANLNNIVSRSIQYIRFFTGSSINRRYSIIPLIHIRHSTTYYVTSRLWPTNTFSFNFCIQRSTFMIRKLFRKLFRNCRIVI